MRKHSYSQQSFGLECFRITAALPFYHISRDSVPSRTSVSPDLRGDPPSDDGFSTDFPSFSDPADDFSPTTLGTTQELGPHILVVA